jgi:FixJ family two-component response regulator/signal transduction histidine kinase
VQDEPRSAADSISGKQAEALLAGERRLLEMVARGYPLPDILASLCGLVEGSASECRCSVLLTASDGATLQHGAAPSLPPSFNEAIHGRPVIPYWGPCAMAVDQKTQVIVADVTADPRWNGCEWCRLALGCGLRSCWTTPILSLAGKVLGTFAIYQHEPGSPTPLQYYLIEQLTHIASIAIERAESEAALKRSEDALSRIRSELAHVARVTTLGALTASIAHEVNQPLSGIITNADTCLRMLAGDAPDIEGARETARRTIRDGNRAADVIARLRALFGKQTAMGSMDLNEAVREVIALSWSEIQRERVAVREDLAADLPPITGDRVQLQQVILNLLLNALEAMSGVDDRPRRLVISTERDAGDHVRLTVLDSGTGFHPRDLDRLFEAFYTTRTDGMGMGLAISRSIIESHQGRLWAAPNEGPGATFSFSIPRSPSRAAAPEMYPSRMPGAETRPAPMSQITPVVFVVDDDVSMRESLESLIRWAGWKPETFSSAREFLAHPAAAAPSCLVLDVELPDLNGLDLQKCFADRSGMPIIFITGYGDVPMTVQAMKAGAVEFLTKPFAADALLNAILHALERSQTALSEAAEVKVLRERYDSLTRREREVMALVVAGLMNKQVGLELGTSEITVKAHRGKVMRKMKTDSLADLVRVSARLNLPLRARP